MERVMDTLRQLYPVSAAMETELRSVLHFKKMNKHAYLIREGEVCRHAWYVQKGLVRCFYTREENEVTTWFAEEDKIIVLFKALFGQKKSHFTLQALEDGELYAIHYHDLQILHRKYPEALVLYNRIFQQYSHLKDLKIRATSGLAPTDRYRYFLKHFPHLTGRLKLEHIASYLDISLRSVNRARGKLPVFFPF